MWFDNFEDAFGGFFLKESGPRYIVDNEKENWTIFILTPGVLKENLSAKIKNGILTIKWNISKDSPAYRLGERENFHCFEIDKRIMAEDITIKLKDGLLIATIKKPELVKKQEKEVSIKIE